MQRVHLIGLGLMLSTTLSIPVMAQMSLTSNPDTTGHAATAQASQTPLPAQTLIDQAVKIAKAKNKTVFVHVGASWCVYCHKLDQMLQSPEVGSIITAHYVLVPLTALESDENKALENPGVDSVMHTLGMHKKDPKQWEHGISCDTRRNQGVW
jgi:thiol:disulfide interchange protein